ncbi:MAG: hypothetical protein QM754_01010 [Tepidisphaeraceae bacterium]
MLVFIQAGGVQTVSRKVFTPRAFAWAKNSIVVPMAVSSNFAQLKVFGSELSLVSSQPASIAERTAVMPRSPTTWFKNAEDRYSDGCQPLLRAAPMASTLWRTCVPSYTADNVSAKRRCASKPSKPLLFRDMQTPKPWSSE